MQKSAHLWNIWIMAAGPSQCQTFGGTNDKAGVAWNSTTLREKSHLRLSITFHLSCRQIQLHSIHVSCDFEFSMFGRLIWRTYFFRMAGFHNVYFCDDCLAVWYNLLRPSLLYQRSVKRSKFNPLPGPTSWLFIEWRTTGGHNIYFMFAWEALTVSTSCQRLYGLQIYTYGTGWL